MNGQRDPLRLWLTFGIAAFGILVVLIAYLVAVATFKSANSPGEIIGAVLGPVVGVVGTLAGYVAGQTAGAAGKERAESRADSAQRQLQAVAQTEPTVLKQARDQFPELFPS